MNFFLLVGKRLRVGRSRLAHSRVFHCRVVPKTQKSGITQNIIAKRKNIKIMLLEAKTIDMPIDQKFFLTSGSGCFAMAQIDRQVNRRTD